jgi:hypothetical protein
MAKNPHAYCPMLGRFFTFIPFLFRQPKVGFKYLAKTERTLKSDI